MIKTTKLITVLTFLWVSVVNISAQQQDQGSVSGIIIEKTSNVPLEFANVIIRNSTDSTRFMGTVTGLCLEI